MAKTPTHLKDTDSLRMQLSRAEVARAREAARATRAEIQARRVGAELSLAKAALAQAQTEMAVSILERQVTEIVEQAEQEHSLLAEQVGKRYAVDWKTTGFDPDTGLLMPLPKD